MSDPKCIARGVTTVVDAGSAGYERCLHRMWVLKKGDSSPGSDPCLWSDNCAPVRATSAVRVLGDRPVATFPCAMGHPAAHDHHFLICQKAFQKLLPVCDPAMFKHSLQSDVFKEQVLGCIKTAERSFFSSLVIGRRNARMAASTLHPWPDCCYINYAHRSSGGRPTKFAKACQCL